MHPRNFGSDKIVCTYALPPNHVLKVGEILHFKHPARFRCKSHGQPEGGRRLWEGEGGLKHNEVDGIVKIMFRLSADG